MIAFVFFVGVIAVAALVASVSVWLRVLRLERDLETTFTQLAAALDKPRR